MFRAERHPGDTGGAASTKARGSRTGMRWRVATLQRRRSVRRQSAYPLRTLQHLFTVRCIGEAASQVATGVQPEMSYSASSSSVKTRADAGPPASQSLAGGEELADIG